MSLLSSSPGWQELKRHTQSTCPKLFYKFTGDKTGIEFCLTDLVGFWKCSLNKSETIAAAVRQRCSIDPSESTSQYDILLQKLNQSIEAGDNQLCKKEKHKSNSTISLVTHLDLPSPLKPLTWTFDLYPQGAAELGEKILRPCLHEATTAQRKLESLHRVIQEKDHVISRLLEKIENSAVDLSLIFPGITGTRARRGRITVAEAQRHVSGMMAFDTAKWEAQFENDSPYAGFDRTSMDNLMAGCEKCPRHTAKQHSEWLERLPEKDELSDGHKSDSSGIKSNKDAADDSSPSSENDFERQATPKHGTKRNRVSLDDGDSTEDDSPRPTKVLRSESQRRSSSQNHTTNQPGKTSRSQSTSVRRSRRSSDSSTASETDTASEADTTMELPRTRKDSSITKSTAQTERTAYKSQSPFQPPPKIRPSSVSNRSENSTNLPSKPTSSTPGRLTPESERRSEPTTPTPVKRMPYKPITPPSRHSLGRLKGASNSPSSHTATAQTQPTTQTYNNPSSSNPSSRSTSTTPSRRLGRLRGSGRTSQSQSQAQSQNVLHHTSQYQQNTSSQLTTIHKTTRTNNKSPREERRKEEEDLDSTPSPESSPDQTTTTSNQQSRSNINANDTPFDGHNEKTSIHSKTNKPNSSISDTQKSNLENQSTKREKQRIGETADQKANRRRTELKSKIGIMGSEQAGRKNRKF